MEQFDVPILFLMFNRPDMAIRVFERIRQVKPLTLYLAVDGPRPDRPLDYESVLACRNIEYTIDWPCSVKTLYRTENLGCKRAVSSAITWFFEHEEAGIILEDDCLPDVTFFEFCRILLGKYANDSKVMHIGGTNLYGNKSWGPYSYFFSRIAHVWGWATWRRAWAIYDVDMEAYPTFKNTSGINKAVTYAPSRSYWKLSFDKTYDGTIDTWDYQWVFAIWKNEGITIIPNQNLVSNIGFGSAATHTIGNSEFANLSVDSIDSNIIIHPADYSVDVDAINYAFAKFYTIPSLWRRKVDSLKKLLPKL